MNLVHAVQRQPAKSIYPNIAGAPTSPGGNEFFPTRIKLGPYEAFFDRTGTGLRKGDIEWLQHGFSMTSTCVFSLEVPADIRSEPQVEKAITAVPQCARDQIRFIQAALGLSVSHLAAALGVERQTIYNWLQADEPPVLHTRTRTRLAEIAEISRKWNLLCPRPAGKLVTSLDFGHGTLLDLLKQTPVDEAALQAAMKTLAEHIEGTRARRHKRVQGITPPPETADDRILRIATSIPLNSAPDED